MRGREIHAKQRNKKMPRRRLDKVDFKTKTVTIDKQEHYIMIKGTINKIQ